MGAVNREAANSRAQLGYLATASRELGRFPGINADDGWPPDKGIAFACTICGRVRLAFGTTHGLAPRYTLHCWKRSQRTFVPPLLRTRPSLHLRTAAPRLLRASQNDSAIQYKIFETSSRDMRRAPRRERKANPQQTVIIHIGIVGCLASFLDALSYPASAIAVGFFRDHKSLTSPTLKTGRPLTHRQWRPA